MMLSFVLGRSIRLFSLSLFLFSIYFYLDFLFSIFGGDDAEKRNREFACPITKTS